MNKIVIATIFTCLLCIFKVQAQTRTFEIRHNVPLDSIRLSDPAILAEQPSGGKIISPVKVTVNDGDTVFDVLKRICSDYGIQRK